MAKIGRNQACPCGSKKKYKKCCGNSLHKKLHVNQMSEDDVPPEVKLAFAKHKANELTRQQQQGLGNPIVSCESHGYRLVAVGNTMHWSKNWNTFHDFLMYYIKKLMSNNGWGNKEISKPYDQRHPILQWYDIMCRYQREFIKEPGKVSSAPMTGAVEAYVQLAYNLYLLAHNTRKSDYNEELQNRLIKRLKNVNEFPGAYYESYVCAALIRAGFEVEFEDERDGTSGHCDFIATCKQSGKKYTVEAKAIRREGVYGATQNTSKANLAQSIRNQIYDSLRKPSQYPRIIFVEMNLQCETREDAVVFITEAVAAVQNAENLTVNKEPADPAYIFLTNHTHQYNLDGSSPRSIAHAGFKIPDFGYGKAFSSLRAMYYAKQKHIDIHSIMQSLETHYNIPATFDGSLPSETFGSEQQRLVVGETYFFNDLDENGLVATVTSATVSKPEKVIYIATKCGRILSRPMSEAELYDYESHPDTFFGVVHRQGRTIEDPFELFEWMLSTYIKMPKEKLLELMNDRDNLEQMRSLSQQDLAITYCERCVHWMMQQRDHKNGPDSAE